MNVYLERLGKLRDEMYREGISSYIICTSDFHGSEYVGDYFKEREFMSGFTGSAGTLLVRMDEALLWTDGRYFIQAKKELEGSSIKLMKQGEEDVPDIFTYLAGVSDFDDVVGFDGRYVSLDFVNRLDEAMDGLNITYAYENDLVDRIWDKRPALPANKVWKLEEKYSGVDSVTKLRSLRDEMMEIGADTFVLTALDETAWLLNLRGGDVDYNPVFLSYMIIDSKSAALYANEAIFSDEIKEYLASLGVEIFRYDEFYKALENLGDSVVLYAKKTLNFAAYMAMDENVRVLEGTSPISIAKAVKNKTECDNMRLAHIKDGVAVTHFIYHLKKNIGVEEFTELSAADILEEYRKKDKSYLMPSFEAIMAYAEHGAIVHYAADENTDLKLEPKGLLLFDTGGHYLYGTTDITRTVALGELTNEEKEAFTIVLKGHLRLGNAKFPFGTTGSNLDVLARMPMWSRGKDYNHGTGHGVGYLLNVHEGPNAFQYKRENNCALRPGMITSDEPGMYVEGKFGIRHESLVLCKESSMGAENKFLEFEYLTMVPFDKEGLKPELLDDEEIKLLNDYHRQVFDNISPYFEGEELEWLSEATSPICG